MVDKDNCDARWGEGRCSSFPSDTTSPEERARRGYNMIGRLDQENRQKHLSFVLREYISQGTLGRRKFAKIYGLPRSE